MADFNANEKYRIGKMQEMHSNHPDKNPWTAIGEEGTRTVRDKGGSKRRVTYSNKDLWNEWNNFQKYGQRVGKPKPPETWLTRRRASGGRRYSTTPEGGFSGVSGVASVRRKTLLGA